MNPSQRRDDRSQLDVAPIAAGSSDADDLWMRFVGHAESVVGERHVTDAHRRAESAVAELRCYALERDDAGSIAAQALREVALEAASSMNPTSNVRPRDRGSRYEYSDLDGVASSSEQRAAMRRLVASLAVTGGSSYIAGALLFMHHFLGVAIVLAVRTALTMWLAEPPTMPLGSTARRQSLISFRSIYFGCVALHISDLVLLSGVVAAFLRAGAVSFAIATAAAASVAAGGSLARTGTLTIGLFVPRRFQAERLFRIGGAAIAAAAAWQFGSSTWLLVAPAAFAAFGLYETLSVCVGVLRCTATRVGMIVTSSGHEHSAFSASTVCSDVPAAEERLGYPTESTR